MKKNKIFEYHRSHSFIDEKNNKLEFATQLYQTGVYVIINNDPALQMNFDPNKICSLEKRLNKDFKEDKIRDLVYGPVIRAREVDGFWKDVTDGT